MTMKNRHIVRFHVSLVHGFVERQMTSAILKISMMAEGVGRGESEWQEAAAYLVKREMSFA